MENPAVTAFILVGLFRLSSSIWQTYRSWKSEVKTRTLKPAPEQDSSHDSDSSRLAIGKEHWCKNSGSHKEPQFREQNYRHMHIVVWLIVSVWSMF